jgi:FkbM family methyltransferase
MDLHFNTTSEFTRWVVKSGHLRESLVVLDLGVQGGENPGWHLLGDYLSVYGLDPIEEVIDDLQERNRHHANLHYHCIAAGSEDGEREFYFNAADPRSSSFYRQDGDRFGTRHIDQARAVQVRRLDTLLNEGTIERPDFLKIDVEGLEKEVLLGGQVILRSVLGVESESSFSVSPSYPRGHFATVQEMLLERKLIAFDFSFNRIPRETFQHAIERKGLPRIRDQDRVGKPATVNVLFCRNPIDEADRQDTYLSPYQPLSVDQLIKMMIIYELHGLNDIALDTAERFRKDLASRFDVDKAIDLLADPACLVSDAGLLELRNLRATNHALAARVRWIEGSKSWRLTAPLRAVRRLFGSR